MATVVTELRKETPVMTSYQQSPALNEIAGKPTFRVIDGLSIRFVVQEMHMRSINFRSAVWTKMLITKAVRRRSCSDRRTQSVVIT